MSAVELPRAEDGLNTWIYCHHHRAMAPMRLTAADEFGYCFVCSACLGSVEIPRPLTDAERRRGVWRRGDYHPRRNT